MDSHGGEDAGVRGTVMSRGSVPHVWPGGRYVRYRGRPKTKSKIVWICMGKKTRTLRSPPAAAAAAGLEALAADAAMFLGVRGVAYAENSF